MLALQACSIAPQLAPSAAGCYALQLDAFPAPFGEMLVPPPPGLVQLDTTLGGQLRVPADVEDDHAIAFYTALGGEAAPVTIFTFEHDDTPARADETPEGG